MDDRISMQILGFLASIHPSSHPLLRSPLLSIRVSDHLFNHQSILLKQPTISNRQAAKGFVKGNVNGKGIFIIPCSFAQRSGQGSKKRFRCAWMVE